MAIEPAGIIAPIEISISPAIIRSPTGSATIPRFAAKLTQLAAVASLPYELRVVFVMIVIEGASGREAAVALDLREGTLWRRLYEARSAIRAVVEAGR